MSVSDIKAMVLAAGLGTRMRPLTDHMPKPLLDVAGTSLIDHILNWLAQSGVQNAVVNSHYKADMLEAHVKGRMQQKPLPSIQMLYERDLLETGGGIKNALPLLGPNRFYSINSDTICIDGKEAALHRLLSFWKEDDMDALLLLQPVEKTIGYNGAGDFFLSPEHKLIRRGDKPKAPYVFTGVQLIHPRLFAHSPEGAFSMNVLYNRQISEQGELHRIHAIVHDGHWLHVGDPKGLTQASEWFATHRA